MSDDFFTPPQPMLIPVPNVPLPSGVELIAAALAKAQGAMSNPIFDSVNPHFRTPYASLAAVRNAVVPALSSNEIAVVTDVRTYDDRGVECSLRLVHSSGQSFTFGPILILCDTTNPQAIGTAETYARRYLLLAATCVSGEADLDANPLVGKGPAVSDAQLADLRALIEEVGADEERLLKALKLGSLAEVRATELPAVAAMIETKRAPAKGKK